MKDINTNPFFDKNTTLVIKGLAIVFMMLHHMIFYPEFWIDGVSYQLAKSLSPIMEAPTKICVSIFCFITGYFYFFNHNKTFKYSLKKIKDILISYWIIFVIFAIFAVVFANYQYKPLYFIAELFALKTPTMYFCWYIYFYIIIMLLLPVITKFMSKNIHIDLFISLIIFDIIYRLIVMFDPFDSELNTIFLGVCKNVHSWLPNVLMGYIAANYNLFQKLFLINKKLISNRIINIVLWILLVLVVPMGRQYYPKLFIDFGGPFHFKITMDILYSFIFIYSVACLCKEIDFKPIKFILIQLGKYSMLMWFISCLFFGNSKNIFQPILYFSKNELIVFIWGIILCFIPSYLIDKIITSIKNKFRRSDINEH